MTKKNILITQFTGGNGGLGLLDPVVFSGVTEAAAYVVDHRARNSSIDEHNKTVESDTKRGKTGLDIFATSAAPGKYKSTVGLDREQLSGHMRARLRDEVQKIMPKP